MKHLRSSSNNLPAVLEGSEQDLEQDLALKESAEEGGGGAETSDGIEESNGDDADVDFDGEDGRDGTPGSFPQSAGEEDGAEDEGEQGAAGSPPDWVDGLNLPRRFVEDSLGSLGPVLLASAKRAGEGIVPLAPSGTTPYPPAEVYVDVPIADKLPPTHALALAFDDGVPPAVIPVHGVVVGIMCPALAHLNRLLFKPLQLVSHPSAASRQTRQETARVRLHVIAVTLPSSLGIQLLIGFLYLRSAVFLVSSLSYLALVPPGTRIPVGGIQRLRQDTVRAVRANANALGVVHEELERGLAFAELQQGPPPPPPAPPPIERRETG